MTTQVLKQNNSSRQTAHNHRPVVQSQIAMAVALRRQIRVALMLTLLLQMANSYQTCWNVLWCCMWKNLAQIHGV